jgi:hypothetical protein
VTKLLQRLHDELVRRHYATTTRESYLRIVKSFHRRTGGRLDRVSPDAAPNPLEQLQVPVPVVLPRSRLKRKPRPA